jgi:hypothetical protein
MAKAKRKYAHLLVGEAKVCKVLGSAENRIKVTLKHWVVGLIPSARIGLILFVSDAGLQRRLLNDHDRCEPSFSARSITSLATARPRASPVSMLSKVLG